MTITAEDFEQATGDAPVDDELERVNCGRSGQVGHIYCGWCDKCDKPRLQCGCSAAVDPPTDHKELSPTPPTSLLEQAAALIDAAQKQLLSPDQEVASVIADNIRDLLKRDLENPRLVGVSWRIPRSDNWSHEHAISQAEERPVCGMSIPVGEEVAYCITTDHVSCPGCRSKLGWEEL
jgi:hypothetical protein